MIGQKMVAGLLAGMAVAAAGAVVTAPAATAATAAKCIGKAPSDFNGDGISDVAIGEPGNKDVHILYGTRSGLRPDATASTPNDQLVRPSGRGGSGFGSAVLALDVNGDGCSDLAVGSPQDGGGVVTIFLGSRHGLITTNPRVLNESVGSHTPVFGDGFGSSLAAGNFDGDKKQDLVIGAPGENGDNGAVYVVPGKGGKATSIPGTAASGFFGGSVAAGDFNHDGTDDLAVGAPFTNTNRGAVRVLNGTKSSSGLSFKTPGTLWTQDTTDKAGHGIVGTATPGDSFGTSLAAGDFNGDGRTDLAIGVPHKDLSAIGAGMVNVIYSAGAAGLSVKGNQGWSQDSPGVSGTAGLDDEFGTSLAAGDFNGNGRTDLAIGVPNKKVGSADEAGMVNVLMGSATGLTTAGQQAWSQASAGIAGTPESRDHFGVSLAAGRTHSDARDDLIIGAAEEPIGTIQDAGQIYMLPGSSAKGLTATGSQAFNADTPGVQGTATKDADFGAAVS